MTEMNIILAKVKINMSQISVCAKITKMNKSHDKWCEISHVTDSARAKITKTSKYYS